MVQIFVKEDNQEVIRQAKAYLNISVLFYFFLGQIFIYRNALQGLGKPLIPVISSVAELLLRSFAAIVLAANFGYIGICLASPIAWIGASLIVALGYRYTIKQLGAKYLYCHQQTELPWH